MNRFAKTLVVGGAALVATIASAQTLQSSHQPTAAAMTTAMAPAKILALVNGVPISQAQFDQELKRIFPYYTIHGNAVPKEYEADFRQKALNNLIDMELAYQEARRRNLQITPLERQKRLAEIRKDYKSQVEFDATILKLFGSRKAFEGVLRHDMLLDKIFLIEVKRKAIVTDAEVRQLYESQKSSFIVPEHVSFQSISAIFPKDAAVADKQAARKRIEQLLPQAKAAKDYEAFGVLAEKFSEDGYRVMMGEHKMVHAGTLEPYFQLAFSMKEGEISGVIESPGGYHILRLNKHEAQKQLTFADVRQSIKENMQKDRLMARNKAFHQTLRNGAKIELL